MTDRLRVAVTLEQCWHRVPGGTARSALDCIEALQAHDSVDMVGVSARHRTAPDPAWTPSIPVEQFRLPRLALYESWHRLRRPAVTRLVGPVDVIHATGMAMPPPSAPIVVTVHDLAFLRDPSQFTRRGIAFFTRAIDLAQRDASIVVCPSRATIDECIEHGFDPARLRLVPWGSHAEPAGSAAVAEVRRRLELPGRFTLWAGTIEPRKNLATLLDAFAALEPDAGTLVLAGPTGWNEDLSGRLARLGERVRLVGFVDPPTLRALYAAADLFCFPSLQEGFGLPVLEAMAQGTAVITSSGTATEEVVGPAGRTIDPTDGEALRAALAELLADDDARGRLAASGLERARSVFTWERTAQLLEGVYREAAA